MTDYNDIELLARTLQAEAGGEGYNGMLAAGAVLMNRVGAGAYGGTVRSNILAPGQFSAWNGVTGYAGGEGAIDMDRITPSAEAYEIAERLVSGDYEDPTGGATHYYNPDVANPAWGERAGGEWVPIGNHVFGVADGGLPTAVNPVNFDPSLPRIGSAETDPSNYGYTGQAGLPDEGEEEDRSPYSALTALIGPRSEEHQAYQQGLDAYGQGPFARGEDGSLNVFGRTLDQNQRQDFSRGLLYLGSQLASGGL